MKFEELSFVPEVKKKIGVQKIVITRIEGPSNLCDKPQVYSSWELAKFGLARSNSTYPGPEQGYNKHKFTVYYLDGNTYSGRLDVKQLCCPDNDQDVKRHVNETISYYAGIYKPGWMSIEQYEDVLKSENKQEYLDYLKTYDV